MESLSKVLRLWKLGPFLRESLGALEEGVRESGGWVESRRWRTRPRVEGILEFQLEGFWRVGFKASWWETPLALPGVGERSWKPGDPDFWTWVEGLEGEGAHLLPEGAGALWEELERLSRSEIPHPGARLVGSWMLDLLAGWLERIPGSLEGARVWLGGLWEEAWPLWRVQVPALGLEWRGRGSHSLLRVAEIWFGRWPEARKKRNPRRGPDS